MLEFLAGVILVSIAFGVSLQSAFWGIIAFTVGIVLLCILGMFAEIGISVVAAKIKQAQTPEAAKARAIKRAQNKKDLENDAAMTLLFIVVCSPLLIGALLALTCEKFTIDYPIPTFLICAAPLLVGLIAVKVRLAKSKKHAGHKG